VNAVLAVVMLGPAGLAWDFVIVIRKRLSVRGDTVERALGAKLCELRVSGGDARHGLLHEAHAA
jgi:hypothetical protein